MSSSTSTWILSYKVNDFLLYFSFLGKWFKACGQAVIISSSCGQNTGRSPIRNNSQPICKIVLNQSEAMLPNSDLLWQTSSQNSPNNNQNLSSLIFAATEIYFCFDWCAPNERELSSIYNSMELRGRDFWSS